jgi:hypothetical protein
MILLTLAALAEPTRKLDLAPEVVSETTAQVRSDTTGELFVIARETAWGTMTIGPAQLEAYGELGFPSGFDQSFDGELFVLAADGGGDHYEWTVGRQRLDLPLFNRLMDGGRAAWTPNEHVRLEAWAGQARHVGLDGIASGAPIARFAASYMRGRFTGTLGTWGELGDAPAVHPDLRLRWRDPDSRLAPDIGLLAAVGAGAEGAAVERARLEVSGRPIGGVRLLAWGEHRQALPGGSQLGPSILASFAPEGAEEIGAAFGWTDVKRSKLWVEGAVQLYPDETGELTQGATAQVSWRPTCPTQSWCAYPFWRGATGPGGVYNAVGGSLLVPVPEPATLSVNGMVVPYRKPYEVWDTALVLGTTLTIHPPVSPFTVLIGGEIARTAIAPIDPRGWATLRMEAR